MKNLVRISAKDPSQGAPIKGVGAMKRFTVRPAFIKFIMWKTQESEIIARHRHEESIMCGAQSCQSSRKYGTPLRTKEVHDYLSS